MSLSEFLSFPEDKPALEFEAGMVIQKVSPNGKHGKLQNVLCRQIDDVGLPPKLAMAFPDLRSTYAGRSYVSDISVYCWERIPRDASGEVSDIFSSPRTSRSRLSRPSRASTVWCGVASGMSATA